MQQAMALHQQGALAEARWLYEQVLAHQPKHFVARYLAGMVALQSGQPELALQSIARALKIKPDFADAWASHGAALQALGRLEEAVTSYTRATAIAPDHAEAYNNRGTALQKLGRSEAALASHDRAIAVRPDHAEAHSNRGNALQALKRFDEALASYDTALAIRPDYAEALCNRGNALQALNRLEDALASHAAALAVRPDLAEAHYHRAVVLQALGRLDEAVSAYDQAIGCRPDYADAWNNRGTVHHALRRFDEALASCDRAIGCAPRHANAWHNRGLVLAENKRWAEALVSYDRAIEAKPDSVQAHLSRAVALRWLDRLDEALTSCERARALAPDTDFLAGYAQYLRMLLCDWRAFDAAADEIARAIRAGRRPIDCFMLLALVDAPELHALVASDVMAERYPHDAALGAISRAPAPGRIRIGYYSADFGEHPVSYLMAELIELHDRDQFEVVGFYSGPPRTDSMHQRLVRGFDRFIDIATMSDRDVAGLSRELGIDVAVDLTGHTTDARPGIFALRAAPVQASYIGYLGTMGADYYDYLLADATLVPEASRAHYVEKVVCLPSYQVNDRTRSIADKVFTRAEVGLPESSFVFCCLNNHFKITPATFSLWMRILGRVAHGVLLLYVEHEQARQNLRAEAERRGVSADRLVFASRMERSLYLARYRVADLFLDTFPYNAGTTASDALWAGVPVLTRTGESFASRVAASLLTAIEVPELITSSEAEYEALAVCLATDAEILHGIKDRIARNRLTTALFDTPRFARHIESAFRAMHERYRAGLPPEHLAITGEAAVR